MNLQLARVIADVQPNEHPTQTQSTLIDMLSMAALGDIIITTTPVSLSMVKGVEHWAVCGQDDFRLTQIYHCTHATPGQLTTDPVKWLITFDNHGAIITVSSRYHCMLRIGLLTAAFELFKSKRIGFGLYKSYVQTILTIQYEPI